ncbi:hypothetical protein BU14_2290s0001 [Porphyra umbilicalis]|uniref:Uncharacterized protein n=1 Tax=Porphyra umbilicalis TaxID=2786 RepID=A0A1X6NJL9_PORUM|nr:hypothetical protein BU14_2290s0001 [Porphyra umbilicalis]|eukprot:OSX68752.1 hypothetical protein BU14_2290s0001 [Porphyra umbilicalis]
MATRRSRSACRPVATPFHHAAAMRVMTSPTRPPHPTMALPVSAFLPPPALAVAPTRRALPPGGGPPPRRHGAPAMAAGRSDGAATSLLDGEGPIGRRGRLAAAAAKAAPKKAKKIKAPKASKAPKAATLRPPPAGAVAAAAAAPPTIKVCTGRTCRRDGGSAEVLAALRAAAAGSGVAVRGGGCMGFCTGTGTAVQAGARWLPAVGVGEVGEVLAGVRAGVGAG